MSRHVPEERMHGSARYVCRTNIDEFKRCEWPTRFAFPPRVGDRVRAVSGPTVALAVVSVTHSLVNGVPCVELELHRG